MARFFGLVSGRAKEATRLGHDGIRTEARGWHVGVTVYGEASRETGRDVFRIVATRGSAQNSTALALGTVTLDEDGRVTFKPSDDAAKIGASEYAKRQRAKRKERKERARTDLVKRWQFFRKHAGGIVGETAKTALELARAEIAAERSDMRIVWTDDADADTSWLEQDGFEQDLAEWRRGDMTCEQVCVYLDGEVLASLGGIFGADDAYRRVVSAELASEAFATLEAKRELRAATLAKTDDALGRIRADVSAAVAQIGRS